MGTLGGGNGGERPFDGGNRPEGLSGLPPEWGIVVVPDDASELAEEAAEVRRQLGRATRRDRLRRIFRRPKRAVPREPSIGLPLLIMAIAVVATLTSLFVVAWPGQHRQVLQSERSTETVAEVTLVDGNGTKVRLRDVLPAVVVLVEGCECERLLADVAVLARDDIAVLAVARTPPSVTVSPPDELWPYQSITPVRPLADPSDALRTRLGLPPPTGPAAVALISGSGQVIRLVPKSRTVNEFRLDLATLR